MHPEKDVSLSEYSVESMCSLREEFKARGLTVVLTNGCFDILHIGHVRYLQASKSQGDRLIVAVNSDESVRDLKGPTRPINYQWDRASIISALRFVDGVFIFRGPRLATEIEILRPDVYTKADDYDLSTLDPTERSALQKVGSEIRFLPFLAGHSTSSTLSKMQPTGERGNCEVVGDRLDFHETLSMARAAVERCHLLEPVVRQVGLMLLSCMKSGGKLFTCGNGGSAADALHMAEELVGRYSKDRVALPAICLNSDVTALTCIANDYGFDNVFSRQLQALGRPGDLLVCFTTSGNSRNILLAIEHANKIGLQTVLVSGKDGGLARRLSKVDIIVPSFDTARIQEIHTILLHQWLEFIDAEFA